MTIRINSRALWFSALRGLGWGFLRFEILFFVGWALGGVPLGGVPGSLVRGVLLLVFVAAALVFPIEVIIVSALQATRPPSLGWRWAVILSGVLAPVLITASFSLSRFWGSTFGNAYVWAVTAVSMAASGFALLPVRGARPGRDEGEVVLPLWWLVLAVVGGLALAAFVYASVYYGWFARASDDEGFAIPMLYPQLVLATTVGCYAVALMWRLCGKSEREAAGSPSARP